MNTTSKQIQRTRRHARIRAKVSGTQLRPRLAVFRSNKFLYAQLIDDVAGKTLAATSSQKLKVAGGGGERALAVGREIAKLAKEKNIEQAVFDRGGFLYAGVIKGVADGARAAGLKI